MWDEALCEPLHDCTLGRHHNRTKFAWDVALLGHRNLGDAKTGLISLVR